MHFPIFRKYLNGKSYFKIYSEDSFEELKITGKHFSLTQIKTSTLPERNFLADMLHEYHLYWEDISAAQYESMKQYCIDQLQQIVV
jgi:hypothetical protein